MNFTLAPAILRRSRSAAGPGTSPARTKPDPRISALRRFAVSISVLTIVGHTLLGFEQAYATPVIGVLAAYAAELTLETIEATARRRPPRYAGGLMRMVDFLLPPHITGLACAMLLYANSQLWPVVFAVVVGVSSKYLIRVKINGRARHVLNPSNIGIVATLLLFPWVGIAPPYQFTEWVSGPFFWIIPAAILLAGTMLNAQLTKKMPLIMGWVAVFALQAVVRTTIEHTNTGTALLVMTGTAFVLFSNYMITDPGTTPVRPWRQAAFGAATAVTYGVLVYLHVVFGLFFALTVVCAVRAAALTVISRRQTVVAARKERQMRQAAYAEYPSPRERLVIAAKLLDAAKEHLDAAANELGVERAAAVRSSTVDALASEVVVPSQVAVPGAVPVPSQVAVPGDVPVPSQVALASEVPLPSQGSSDGAEMLASPGTAPDQSADAGQAGATGGPTGGPPTAVGPVR